MFEDIYIIHLKEKGVTCKFLFLGGVNVFWNYPSLLGSTFFVLRISTKHLFVMQRWYMHRIEIYCSIKSWPMAITTQAAVKSAIYKLVVHTSYTPHIHDY
jgi:hypothetical protein